jgi:hypothetical protein
MPILAMELARIVFGTVAGTLFVELLRASGRGQKETSTIGATMSEYDIIGDMDATDLIGDDDFGGIGEDVDLIGDEYDDDDDDDGDALLEALTVSGAGDTEIVGDEIGRRRRRRRPRVRNIRKALRKRALRKMAMRNSGAVISRGLSRRRRFPIGFVPTNVGAGVTLLIPAAPQNLFRPERLVIPSDIAFDFGVVNINVGNTSQLVQAVEVPGAMFSEVAVDTNVTFDTAEVGNQLSVQVRNKAAIQIQFTAGVLGTIAK